MEDPQIPVGPAVGTGGPRKPFESLLSQTEPFLKLLSLVSIFLYGIGLLVTNTFLSKYGTSDFTLLKPQCVFTGIWTLALLLFAAGPGIAVLIFLSDQERRVPARILRAVLSFVPLCYVAGFATMAVFSLYLGEVGVVSTKPLLFDNGVPGWRPLLILMSVIPSFLLIARREPYGPLPVLLPQWLALILPTTLLASFFIGSSTYETVRREVGGGSPAGASFYFASEGKDMLSYLRTLSAPYHDGDPTMTIEGNLLYSTSDHYLIRITYCRTDPDKNQTNSVPTRRDQLVMVDRKLLQGVLLSSIPPAPVTTKCPYATR